MEIAEYTTGGRKARVDGFLFDTGEKLGDWTAFSLYYVKSDGKSMRSLECAQHVIVGKLPYEDNAIVIRILRGVKQAGRADDDKTQQCHYVLLKVGSEFKHAALQHVHADPLHSLTLYYGQYTNRGNLLLRVSRRGEVAAL